MSTFRVSDEQRGRIVERELDVAPLLQLAEASGGNPIRRLTTLVCDQLQTRGVAVRDDGRKRLYQQLSTALARDEWPEAFDLVNGDPPTGRCAQEARSPERPMNEDLAPSSPGVFEKEVRYPNARAQAVYASLVGLEEQKTTLLREAGLLTQPARLEAWSQKHHGQILPACGELLRRKPFIVFAGDVGTGKTALAESFGDAFARDLGMPALLLRLSVQARGSGLVGEMTTLISSAFQAALARAASFDGVTILLLDEADALASSRETQQMHHEDRAGVNALIQGVDQIADSKRPMLVVFCTNRPGSLDPAVRRRAADVFSFSRPNDEQRRALFESLLMGAEIKNGVVAELTTLTGPTAQRDYGFTYSDIRTRLVPNALREAYGEDQPLTGSVLLKHARTMNPTPPFSDVSA